MVVTVTKTGFALIIWPKRVQKVDSRINHKPVDNSISFLNANPLDIGLSFEQRYPLAF